MDCHFLLQGISPTQGSNPGLPHCRQTLYRLSHLLRVPLSLHLVYIAAFGVAFLYSGSLRSSLYCRVSSLWVGLHQWLVEVSWLGKLVSVFWWVELDVFSLECSEVSNIEFWGVCGFCVTLASLYFNAQGCVPALIEN